MTETKNRFLLVPGAEINAETYINLVAITNALIEKGEEVCIAAKESAIASFKGKLALNSKAKIIEKAPEQKVLLQFPGQTKDIKSIQWGQNKDQLNIYVTMQDGTFKSDSMKLTNLTEQFTEIVMLQTSTVEKEYINEKSKLISIGSKAGDGKVAETDKKSEKFTDEKHSSLAEDSYAYLQKRGGKISPENANILLAGIMFATKNFTSDLKSPETYITCAELMKLEATNQRAKEIAGAFKA